MTRPRRSFPYLLCVLSFLFLLGCSSRPPIISRQPPPSPPAPVSPERAEAAKRSTDLDPEPANRASPDAKSPAAPGSVGYIEEGNASWYGVPYHGRRASNGEIYDMYKLTAAHRTLPFETIVRITNLSNSRSTIARITDRGPFIENRIVDLSLAGARELDMVAAGIVPVRLEVLSGPDPTAGFFTVQVGAFLDRANAERLRDRLAASHSNAAVHEFDSPDGLFYRVRVGRIAGEQAARQFADSLRQNEGFATPFVIRLDE